MSFVCTHSQILENQETREIIEKAAFHVYNTDMDSSKYYIQHVQKKLNDHPIIPLIKAMSLLWNHIPVFSDEIFDEIIRLLSHSISLSNKHDPELKNPEIIFFTMTAYGLLAELYADQNEYFKAVHQANKAYHLIKKGDGLIDEYPEFLLTSGLYNYFIIKYPEKHPIYAPLLWFFKNGDAELGLQQLKRACEETIFGKVEAHVYLSYIYLKYEQKPKISQEYLRILCEKYPNNIYAKTKLIETMANKEDFKNISREWINEMKYHSHPYYQLAGHVFWGYYSEIIQKNKVSAEYNYRKGLKIGHKLVNHGEFFKSFGYLGLARVLIKNGNSLEAKEVLKKSIKYSENNKITKEANELLQSLN